MLATVSPPQKSWESLIPLEHGLAWLGIVSASSLYVHGRIGPIIELANQIFTIWILKQKSAFHDTFIYFSKNSIPCLTFLILLNLLHFPA